MKINSWPDFDEDQIAKVSSILKSGNVNYWTGDEGKNFEIEFAKWCGLKHSLTMANGTVSLVAAYKALGLGGDEFITTPRSFVATTSAGVLLRAKPVFADVDLIPVI